MRAGARRSPLVRGVGLLAGLVLAGCSAAVPTGGSAGGSAVVPVAATGATTPPHGPSVVKTIDPAALRAAVQATATELRIPGAVVEVHTPRGAVTAAVGTTERGAQVPPDGATHVRIASITKTMTSAVVLQLVGQGRLRLSDPVAAYVPGVPNGGNITVEQLLTMRSGLYGYTNDPAFAATLDADPAKVWTPQEVLAIAFRHPPEFPPGAGYDYSNTNYALLGLVVEKVCGKPLDQAFRDRLFGPRGLTRTSLPATTDSSIPAPSSHGYMYGGSRYALVTTPYPPEVRAAAESGTLAPVDYTRQSPSYAMAAGGAISTADDLGTWIRALVGGQVIGRPDLQRQWLDSPMPTEPGAPAGAPQYGYGIERQMLAPTVPLYFHFGEMPGYDAFAGHDPVNHVTIVIWSNLTVGLDSRQTANALLSRVVEQVYALPSPEPAAPVPTG
ncbi:serine hydrolase [Actinomycetospora sp. TBRC 11914]|uniref:serine hydrolase domain-containing protein n=1 Tax=Actinomycetospora sp. TBRC 11914 TaxID=2729387 RepID=UPI00145CB669|nr:serine hydrolase domain-containing protein [Actinomycetospora sp. TBRC 11914]NMO89850.1 beta-lactamase family protein [Actinomycetospora sp. TBRC 11914]